LNLPWNPGTTGSLAPGNPAPEQPEALTLPINHGVRLDKDQGVGPVAPDLAEQHPEGPVCGPERGSCALLLENSQLLAQREILNH